MTVSVLGSSSVHDIHNRISNDHTGRRFLKGRFRESETKIMLLLKFTLSKKNNFQTVFELMQR